MPERILVYGMTGTRGGVESYIMNFLRHFDPVQIQFDFVISDDVMACTDDAQKLGAQIYHVPRITASPLGHIRAFKKILKDHPEYKTVYYNINSAFSCVAMIAALLTHRRRVAHSHNAYVESRKLLHILFRPLLNALSDVRLACSDKAACFMFGEKAYRDGKVIIIKNAIDLDQFHFDALTREQMRENMGLADKLIIGHVGRFTPQKNHKRLIEIFKAVHDRNAETVLLLAGEGEDEQTVRNQVDQLGLAESVCFLGVRRDINRLMQAMDVFLLPSLFEGLPIVGVEAQAAGLHCVFADTITRQADISGNVTFLSLEQDNVFWAEQILQPVSMERCQGADRAREAGYDINAAAARLAGILCNQKEKSD